MKSQPEDGKLRKRYLLGYLSQEGERQQFEERLLTDDQFFEELLIAEDELIDDYLRGALTEEEKERFENHFLVTAERRQKLSFARALRKYVSAEAGAAPVEKFKKPSQWLFSLQSFFSSPARLAISLLILLALGFGLWRIFLYQSDVTKGMIALKSAYREQRPTEARITGFDYAPLPVTRGDNQAKFDRTARDRAERILLDAANDEPGAASQHALGRLYMAEHKFDEAVEEFNRALKSAPNDAQLHSDMGAALLEMARADKLNNNSAKSMEEFARSLEHLNRALELNGSLQEALFNRALYHQYMMLNRQAEEDWRNYLKLDSSSRWADEARDNLKLLEEQDRSSSQSNEQSLQNFLDAYMAGDDERAWTIASLNREPISGKLIWEQLIDSYLEMAARGETDEARMRLNALAHLGDLERSKADDFYTSELAQFYRRLPLQQIPALAQACALVRSGHELYVQSKYAQAIDAYTRAKQLFEAHGDAQQARFVDYWIAYSYAEETQTEQALPIFEELARVCQQGNYKWLLMRTLNSLSSTQHNLNEHSRAIGYCDQSLKVAEQINDSVGKFNALSGLIELYRYVGNYRQSIESIQQSLPLLNTCPLNPLQRMRHYAVIASALNSSGLYDAALDYQKEALQLALAANDSWMTSLAYAHLASIYGKLGNYAEAVKNAQTAYELANAHASELWGKLMTAYSSLNLGNIYREQGDFGHAVESYSKSIELYDSLDFHLYLYHAHKGRLFSYVAQGNDSLASEELQTTLGLFEEYRSEISEENDRNNFFNVEQGVYDLAIDFAYSRLKDAQRAFEYSESSRARSLLNLITAGKQNADENNAQTNDRPPVSSPLSLDEIRGRLPEGAQLLQYAVLSNKLLIWVVSKNSFEVRENKVSQQELSEKVRAYLRALESGQDSLATSEELFDILVRPVASLLDSNKSIYIIPDKVLNYLPFGALHSSASNRYMIEDYSLSYSPSATVFITCSEEANKRVAPTAERLLAVGNPAFNRNLFPTLPDLPSAVRESQQVAALYHPSILLLGSDATRARVEREMENSDVVHLALHSILDEVSPSRSKLVIARERDEATAQDSEGVMPAYEIYRLKLPRTRLVVLSACQTGAGNYYAGEGVMNIARPFIAASVPLVVASLWPVDSNSTAELMSLFHKYRKAKGLSTTEALKRAQLDMLHSPEERLRNPTCWAAFISIGGYASF